MTIIAIMGLIIIAMSNVYEEKSRINKIERELELYPGIEIIDIDGKVYKK